MRSMNEVLGYGRPVSRRVKRREGALLYQSVPAEASEEVALQEVEEALEQDINFDMSCEDGT